MTAPEVFCHHQCAYCDKVAIVDAKLDLPKGWRRAFDRDDDLVSLCDDCARAADFLGDLADTWD